MHEILPIRALRNRKVFAASIYFDANSCTFELLQFASSSVRKTIVFLKQTFETVKTNLDAKTRK